MTDADKQKLKSLTLAGVPTKEIANQLFFSMRMIQHERKKMGLLKPKDYCNGRMD